VSPLHQNDGWARKSDIALTHSILPVTAESYGSVVARVSAPPVPPTEPVRRRSRVEPMTFGGVPECT
jgi:hypothetical protein